MTKQKFIEYFNLTKTYAVCAEKIARKNFRKAGNKPAGYLT